MPYRVVREFEQQIAEYAGSRFAVSVESGTAAILLSCMYRHVGLTTIPARTYPSVPCSIILAGGSVAFHHEEWSGIYELRPYGIWDGALRFKRGMYHGGLHCLSFHVKKHLRLERGGMILTDDPEANRWLRLARFDGRRECPLTEQPTYEVIGLNAYLTPQQAAYGLQVFNVIKNREIEDLPASEQDYPDLSQSPIYTTRDEG